MPDLNLIDEGGIEESSAPPSPAPRRSGGGGGGGMRVALISLIVLVIVGAGTFFLYKRGIFPFKKKQAVVAQVQDEALPVEPEQQYPEQQKGAAQSQAADTAAVALLETPPVEEKAGKSAESKMKEEKTEAATGTSEMMTGSGPKLSEMRGDYTIQVVAFREKSKADDIVKNLEYAGYPAFVERVPMKGGDWYTVRIGRYPSRQDAKQAVKSFATQLRSSYVIDKVRNK